MDVTSGQSGRIGGRIGSDEEIFDRVWKDMGFLDNMPLSEVYGLLKNIEYESCQKWRMANDPGVVVMTQMVINRVQDMFGEKADQISMLKEDSLMILDWIISEGDIGAGGYKGVDTVPQGLGGRRFSVCDSDEMSDDETASLMEFEPLGFKRSISVPSSICDSHIDMVCTLKPMGFSLGEILDELEEYHHNIEMSFISLESRLDGLRDQNAYHLQYLKNVSKINDGLFERVRSMRHEAFEIQQELTKIMETPNRNLSDPAPVSAQIDLVNTTFSPGDTQIYHRLTKSGTESLASRSTSNSATYNATNTTHKTTTILIAFISIFIFMISFFTSK